MSDPLCRCSHEAGDSDCPVHPTCAECGADISGHSAIADARAKLSDCNAALVGYSEGEPGEVLRRLIAQHAIDAAEIARGDIERAKLERALSKVCCNGEPHTCEQEAIAAAEGRTDRLIERLAIVEPVFEAAEAWRVGRDRSIVGTAPQGGQRSATGVALIDAVDAALAAEQKQCSDG